MALPPILVPDDDALALLLRGQSKPVPMGVALLDKYLGLRNGDVLEVHGLAGAGKSQWCMAAVAHAILPPTVANVPIGGRGVRAVYFETDGKFPLWRFLHILESRLKAAAQAHLRPRDGPGELYALLGGKEAYEAVVRRCLEHLTVHRCHSGAQLAFALQEEAAGLAAEGATDREAAATPLTGLLVLDPLGPGAFYWTDRSTDGDAPPPWVAALERIRSAYAAVVILATGPAAHARWCFVPPADWPISPSTRTPRRGTSRPHRRRSTATWGSPRGSSSTGSCSRPTTVPSPAASPSPITTAFPAAGWPTM